MFEFLQSNFDLILVFVMLAFILVSLYFEILGASFTFMVAIVILGFFGILTPSEILSGLQNEQIAVIIILLLIGDIIRRTGAVEVLFDRIFHRAKTQQGFLSRMMIWVAGFSAFLNNTPLVAVMMPYINNWCRRNNISPSKFLLPLSYAAILGGCATLIGTSTNLIVNGLVIDQRIIPGMPALNIFDFFYVGGPMLVFGFFYLFFFGDKLLHSKAKAQATAISSNRSYHIEAKLRANTEFIGNSVEEADLMETQGLQLVELYRKNEMNAIRINRAVILEHDDVLVYGGDTENITEIIQTNDKLILPSIGIMTRKKKSELVEIVVSHNSSLINKKIRDINFRAKYDAAIVSVHRNDFELSGRLRDITVRAGDVLLLYAGEDFFNRTQSTSDFYYISKVKDFMKLEGYKTWILIGGLIVAILLSAFHLVNLFMGLLILLMVLIALNIAHPKELPKSVDYDLALIIVLSLALGIAMKKTGAAELIANFIISIFMPLGIIGLLLGIYIITALLGAYITNKAAVAIIFPISLTMSLKLGLPPVPFILIVAHAAAANFMTPIGYQTNLMVYGPGRYTFNDFFRVGFPLTVIYMIVTVTILSIVFLKDFL